MSITNNRLPWLIDINVFMTPISEVGGGVPNVDALAIYNGYYNMLAVQNNEINYDVVLAKGTWTIEVLHVQTNLAGIQTIKLDSTTVGTIDSYNGGGGADIYNVRSSVTGVSVTKAGKYRLKLITATKNAGSGGYAGFIQHIQLRRTA